MYTGNDVTHSNQEMATHDVEHNCIDVRLRVAAALLSADWMTQADSEHKIAMTSLTYPRVDDWRNQLTMPRYDATSGRHVTATGAARDRDDGDT